MHLAGFNSTNFEYDLNLANLWLFASIWHANSFTTEYTQTHIHQTETRYTHLFSGSRLNISFNCSKNPSSNSLQSFIQTDTQSIHHTHVGTHLSASSNTTYSTDESFNSISTTRCRKRPGVAMMLEKNGCCNCKKCAGLNSSHVWIVVHS